MTKAIYVGTTGLFGFYESHIYCRKNFDSKDYIENTHFTQQISDFASCLVIDAFVGCATGFIAGFLIDITGNVHNFNKLEHEYPETI
jgi:hypothetical protein